MKFEKTLHGLVAAVLATGGLSVQAAYPEKPIRIVIGYPQGGASDLIAKTFTNRLNDAVKQHVIIENRAGRSGADAAERVSKAPADGYTLFLTNAAIMAMTPAASKVDYDPQKNFDPVYFIGNTPNVLVIPASLQVKTVADLIAMAKAKPDGLSYASSGDGSIQNFAGEMFKVATGARIKHQPYRGSGQALGFLMMGEVSMSFDNLPSSMAHINSGKLRALAVLSPKRVESIASVPTMAEAGVKGVEISNWYGLMGPSGLSREATTRLTAEMSKIYGNNSEARRELTALGIEPESLNAADFARLVRTDVARLTKIATQAKIAR